MKLSEQDVIIRKEIINEANLIGSINDEILAAIHKTESESKALGALRKYRQNLEAFRRQVFYLGKLN